MADKWSAKNNGSCAFCGGSARTGLESVAELGQVVGEGGEDAHGLGGGIMRHGHLDLSGPDADAGGMGTGGGNWAQLGTRTKR